MENEFIVPKIEDYKTAECPVCQSDDFRAVFIASDYEYDLPGSFNVAECRNCGLIYQNPQPPFSDIARYYTEKYEPYGNVDAGLMKKVRELFLIKPRIKKYKKLIGDSGNVLDVGCSTGNLLYDLKNNTSWDLTGIEPDKKSAESAAKKGLNIFNGSVEEYSLPSHAFDLIIVNHVLEHVPDPHRAIAKIHVLLKTGGYLVGEIPCCDCLERIIFGKYWQGYHLPRHLTWFSKKLLITFLQQNGFKNISIKLQPQPSCWQVSLRNNITAGKKAEWLKRFLSGHGFLLCGMSFPVLYLLTFIGMAPIIKFTAQKEYPVK